MYRINEVELLLQTIMKHFVQRDGEVVHRQACICEDPDSIREMVTAGFVMWHVAYKTRHLDILGYRSSYPHYITLHYLEALHEDLESGLVNEPFAVDCRFVCRHNHSLSSMVFIRQPSPPYHFIILTLFFIDILPGAFTAGYELTSDIK